MHTILLLSLVLSSVPVAAAATTPLQVASADRLDIPLQFLFPPDAATTSAATSQDD